MKDSNQAAPPLINLSVLPWFALLLLLLTSGWYVAISEEHRRLERDFDNTANDIFRQIDLKLRTLEVGLTLFENLASSGQNADGLRKPAQLLGLEYPELYQLKLVAHEQPADTNHLDTRIQQLFDNHDPVINSNRHLRAELIRDHTESAARRTARLKASNLFKLPEGDTGFLLYRSKTQPSSIEPAIGHTAVAVVHVAGLIPTQRLSHSRWQASLVVNRMPAPPATNLLHVTDQSRSALNWLPALSITQSLHNDLPDMTLLLRFQPRLEDLSARFISWLAIITLIFSWALWRLLQRCYQLEIRADCLYRQARLPIDYDSLTGLPSPNLFMDRLSQSLRYAERHGNSVALCYLDFTRFSSINDRYGRDAGDELLCQAAHRINNCLRCEDSVSRLQADEFVILMPCVMHQSDAQRVVERIRATFDELFFIKQHVLEASISCGVAIFPYHATDAEGLIAVADLKMYEQRDKMIHEDCWFHQQQG